MKTAKQKADERLGVAIEGKVRELFPEYICSSNYGLGCILETIKQVDELRMDEFVEMEQRIEELERANEDLQAEVNLAVASQ